MKECLLLICLIMLSLLENTAPHVLQVVNFMVITDEMETNRQKSLFIIYIVEVLKLPSVFRTFVKSVIQKKLYQST
jgi:hypothetical protein